MKLRLTPLILLCAVALGAGCRPQASARSDGLEPCRIQGIEREILCGRIAAAENPDQPSGRTVDVHFAVVPAVARNAREDPVFVLAGGPGQAATRVAGAVMPIFAELNARRDIVFIDQRGTGTLEPAGLPGSVNDAGRDARSLAATRAGAGLPAWPQGRHAPVRDLDRGARFRRGPAQARRRAGQPVGSLLRHARRTRVSAPVPAARAHRRARRRGAARHGVARRVCRRCRRRTRAARAGLPGQ